MLFSGGPFLLSQHLDYYQNYQKTQVTCLFWFNFGCFICQHTLIVARYTFRLEHVARPWLRFLCVPCLCVYMWTHSDTEATQESHNIIPESLSGSFVHCGTLWNTRHNLWSNLQPAATLSHSVWFICNTKLVWLSPPPPHLTVSITLEQNI